MARLVSPSSCGGPGLAAALRTPEEPPSHRFIIPAVLLLPPAARPRRRFPRSGGEGAASLAGASYRWLQSLKDRSVSVSIGPLPAGTRGKQLVVAMKPQRLSVALLGEEARDAC